MDLLTSRLATRTDQAHAHDVRTPLHLVTPPPLAVDEPGMPPIRRGSMPALPWQGWGRRMAQAAPWQLSDAAVNPSPEPWEAAASARRRWLMFWVLLATGLAGALLWRAQPSQPLSTMQQAGLWLQMGLFSLLFAWVSAGCITAVMGFLVVLRGDRHALSARDAGSGPIAAEARTAVVMPICNEDVATVFAGLRATCESMHAAQQAGGASRLMDVFVLSDTSDPELRAAELAAWQAVRTHLRQRGIEVPVYYRWRQRRTRRKAGNVADFCRRWGRAYRYMVVLDADSVMGGDALLTLVRLMERHPRAGILQTAPCAVGMDSVHARVQQFASRVTGRLFTAGMQYWQLGEAHYWGHNAIIRIAPFMQHCGLARLPGQGALSGEILSHDFVEAALMRRAGWQVWLVGDLEGSYEQQPPHLLAELQRDRRWCQGNLQNARLITEPGIRPVHRAMLATGAMAYASAPLWLLYVVLGSLRWAGEGNPWLQAQQIFSPVGMAGLWVATGAMLMLPRVLGVLAVCWRGEQRQHGGTLRLAGSALGEALVSMLQAPLRMAAHSLFVVGALAGWRLQWKSPPREAGGLGWGEAAGKLLPLTLAAAAVLGVAWALSPGASWWLLPLVLPLMLAVPITVCTSRTSLGGSLRRNGWLLVPEEQAPPAVLRRAWSYARQPLATLRWGWQRLSDLQGLAELVKLAMGPRRTTRGLRGQARVQLAGQWMARRGDESDAAAIAPRPADRMRLLSEPHTLQLLRTAVACSPMRQAA